MDKRTIIPISCDVIKTGNSRNKQGKEFSWTLYKVQAAVLPSNKQQSFSTFDDFGSKLNTEVEVEVETKVVEKDGKTYTNYNIRLPKRNPWEELSELLARVEKLEAKTSTTTNEPSLGDESKNEAGPEDAFETNNLPF